jgi:hypothetical protein
VISSDFKPPTSVIVCVPEIIESYLMSLAIGSSFQQSKNAARLVISIEKKPAFAAQKRRVVQQISRLREKVEDLMDYLDLLEARAKNEDKRTYTTEEVRARLGLSSR